MLLTLFEKEAQMNKENKNIIEKIENNPYQLIKSNDIVQRVKFDLTETEQNIVACIVEKIDPTNLNLLEYEFNIIDFYKEFEAENSEINSRGIKASFKKLRDKSVFILLKDGTETTVSWINKLYINIQNSTVKIRLDEDMISYLFTLKNNFNPIILRIILKMKSQYSVIIYQLLKCYEASKFKIFQIDDLKKILMVENIKSYESIKEFRMYVLDQALREINFYSDILVEYEEILKGKKVDKIYFMIHKKRNVKRLTKGR